MKKKEAEESGRREGREKRVKKSFHVSVNRESDGNGMDGIKLDSRWYVGECAFF